MQFRLLVAAVAAIAVICAGCAVGNFLAGAPSARSSTPTRALLLRRCGGCHETPEPEAMTSEAWQAALERMKHRMRLPASEWDSLAAMSARGARN